MSRLIPTVRRKRLSYDLRKLRQDADLTIDEVAARSDMDPSMISRIETVKRGISPVELRVLLETYGVVGEKRDAMLALCRKANQQGWWQTATLPDWVATFVALETDAGSVHAYASELVPGLLQTEDYYRWFMGTAPVAADPAEIDRRIKVRLTRQQRLLDSAPLDCWAILNEAVIERLVGAPAHVARSQLTHLREMAKLPHVSILILPFASGLHPAMEGDFTLMGFDDPIDPDVVYLEYQVGSVVIEDSTQVRRYASIWDHLIAQSQDAHKSLTVIESVLNGLET